MDRKRSRTGGAAAQESSKGFSVIFEEFKNRISKDGFIFAGQIFIAESFRLMKNSVVSAFRNIRDELRADAKAPLRIDGLEKVRKHRPDYLIVLFMGLIMLTSLITMYVLSPQRATFLNHSYGGNYGPMHFFTTQLRNLGIGVFAFIVVSRIPLAWIYRYSGRIMYIGFALCVALAVLGFAKISPAKCELGACRWFQVGQISVQPSEFLKVGMLVALSVFLGARAKEGKVNSFKETILPVSLVVGLMLLLVAIFQKDLGTAISALAIVACQFLMAGISRKNIIRTGAILVVATVGLVIIAPHRMQRMTTFLSAGDCSNLSSQESKDEYHICHAKIAIGSGGLTGVGIGNSVQSAGYLPESINDSVFAILGETFGFVGLMLILGMFLALIIRIIRAAAYIQNPASRLVAAGVFGWFAFHTVMNISAMIGILPLTGITMPLISYGGTSIIFMSAALGLVFNISAYTSQRQIEDFKEGKGENSRSRGRLGRTRNAGRRSF